MGTVYEWLYDHYAEPRLSELPAFADDRLQALAEETVPQEERLDLTDWLLALRLDWCTEAFALGVRLGISLSL